MASPNRDADGYQPAARPPALSDARRRALSILHPAFPLPAEIFAHYMWPTSASWTRGPNAGRGIRLKAHTFLAGLERDGLARHCRTRSASVDGYVLTSRGEQAIDLGPCTNLAD